MGEQFSFFDMREVDMAAPFGRTWGTVFHQNKDAMLIATLSSHRFRVPGIQQQRVTIEDTDTGDSQPLPRNQLETLVEQTRGAAGGGFDLERLRRASTRCGGVGTLSRHVLDQEGGRIIEREETHESAVFVDTPPSRRRLTMSSPSSAWSRPISQKWVLIPRRGSGERHKTETTGGE